MRIALSRPTCRQRPARLSLLGAFALWRSRRALANLDSSQLEDVGITATQAHAEAERPFWDAPASWKC